MRLRAQALATGRVATVATTLNKLVADHAAVKADRSYKASQGRLFLEMQRSSRLAAVAAAAAGMLVASGISPAVAGRPVDWRLSWHQEFGGTAGARLDPRYWTYDRGGEPQWGNAEWQFYTERSRNVSMDGHGNLAITARRERLPGMANCLHGTCDITSARITTKDRFAQAYGRFEARIKVPRGKGMWPAFWLLGDNIDQVSWPGCGEIDIMEVLGHQPGTVYGTIHAQGYADAGIGGQTALRRGDLAGGFHVYGVEWSPGVVRWMLDGRTYFVARRSQLRPGQAWPFDRPFYVLLNLAVGGGWPGPPTSSTHFPAQMLIDWIRVYRQL